MKIEELMNASSTLNDSDIKLLQFIIHNQKDICHLNSQEMASFCHVSRTTLLRAVQKIGLTTIFDLQILLQDNDRKEETTLQFENICDIYHDMVNAIKKIPLQEVCGLLYRCKTIYIYGTGNEQKTIADEFKRIFTYIGKFVIEVFDYGEAEMISSSMKKEDLFLIISLSGETEEGIKIITLMNNKQITSLSITRLQNNTIARMCAYNLHVATSQVATQISYELVAGFYMLMDNIFIHYLNYQQEVACGT